MTRAKWPSKKQKSELGTLAAEEVRRCLNEGIEPLSHNVRTLTRRHFNLQDQHTKRLNNYLTIVNLKSLVLEAVPGSSVNDVEDSTTKDATFRFIFPDVPFTACPEPTPQDILEVQLFLMHLEASGNDDNHEGSVLSLARGIQEKAGANLKLKLGTLHRIIQIGLDKEKAWLVYEKLGSRSVVKINEAKVPAAVTLKRHQWHSGVEQQKKDGSGPRCPGLQPRPVGLQEQPQKPGKPRTSPPVEPEPTPPQAPTSAPAPTILVPVPMVFVPVPLASVMPAQHGCYHPGIPFAAAVPNPAAEEGKTLCDLSKQAWSRWRDGDSECGSVQGD